MTPVEQAAAVYEREDCARTFKEDLEYHLLNGWVINTPTLFIMARPVERYGPPSLIVDPSHVFENPDCWHIYLQAGNVNEVWKFDVHQFPWVSFERRNRLRFYRSKEIHDRTARLIT
jgi:hypothetical protein